MGASTSTPFPNFPDLSGTDGKCARYDVVWVERREKIAGVRPGGSVAPYLKVGENAAIVNFKENVLENDAAIVYAVHARW